jgi:hypothetical protein
MTLSGWRHTIGQAGYLLLLLFICLLPVLPNWFDQRLPATHEVYRYLLLADWFRDALAADVWYPRWLPEMNGGFGYPEFVFYQPAYFFINALLSFWVDPSLLRQLLTVSLIALVGGLGVHRLARCHVTPLPALLLTACFQLAPYIHTNLYLRGDLSEWMVSELVPWPVYFLLQSCQGVAEGTVRERFLNWLGLTLFTAVLCYSHPVALMFLPPLLLFIGGICLTKSAPGRRLIAGGELLGAVVVGLALSSPYWLTVLLMKPLVHVTAVLDGFIAWKNTVSLQYLLFGSLIEGKGFQEFLGAPFVAAALAGWWFGRKKPFIFAAGVVYLIMVVAMTPFGQLFWKLYPFSLLQFPWRLTVFVPLLQVVCLIGFLEPTSGWRFGKRWLFGGCCMLAAWSLWGHFGFRPAETPDSALQFNQESLACLRNFAQTGTIGRYVSTLDAGEWTPLTAVGISALPARGEMRSECNEIRQALSGITAAMGLPDMFNVPPVSRPLLETSQSDWIVYQNPAHTPFRLDYTLHGEKPVVLTINQIYLPGWKIMANANEIERLDIEQSLLPDGRMQLRLSSGKWRLRAWYDGPPGWQLRSVLIVALCGIAGFYWLYRLGRCNETE